MITQQDDQQIRIAPNSRPPRVPRVNYLQRSERQKPLAATLPFAEASARHESQLDPGRQMAIKVFRNKWVYLGSMAVDILTTFAFLLTSYQLANPSAQIEQAAIMWFVIFLLSIAAAHAEIGVIASSAACKWINQQFQIGAARSIFLTAARMLLLICWGGLIFNLIATVVNIMQIFDNALVGLIAGTIASVAITAYHYTYYALGLVLENKTE